MPMELKSRHEMKNKPTHIRARLFWSDIRGNIGIVAALSALPLLLVIGVALDYTRAAAARSDMQAAMDAAVLAGARDGTTSWANVAANMFNNSIKTSDYTVASKSFSNDSSGNYVGTASGRISTTFLGILSYTSLSISATATVAVKAATDNVCILLTNTSASPGLLLNSGASISASNCQVHIKSTGNPAATFNASTTLSTKKICVAGSSVLDNGGTHPNLTKSCTTASDPFSGTLPTPPSSTCTYSNYNVNSSTALSPGVYCGWTNFNGSPTVTLASGVYVIKGGGWNFSGTLTGTGVTFYFPDSSYIQFNGTSKLSLSAPTSGAYANLLIYEAIGLSSSSFTMNATAGAAISGLIYLPSRQFTLNAGASATSDNLTMVFNTLTVNQVSWTLDSSPKTIGASGSSSAAGVYLLK